MLPRRPVAAQEGRRNRLGRRERVRTAFTVAARSAANSPPPPLPASVPRVSARLSSAQASGGGGKGSASKSGVECRLHLDGFRTSHEAIRFARVQVDEQHSVRLAGSAARLVQRDFATAFVHHASVVSSQREYHVSASDPLHCSERNSAKDKAVGVWRLAQHIVFGCSGFVSESHCVKFRQVVSWRCRGF